MSERITNEIMDRDAGSLLDESTGIEKLEKNDAKYGRGITAGLFIFYLLTLTWVVLFKMGSALDVTQQIQSVNLIPLHGSMTYGGGIDWNEIINNVILFVPFGIYISTLKTEWNFGRRLISAAALSLVYEILQYVLAIGASDITDVIANAAGCAIGIAFFEMLYHTEKDMAKPIINITASVVTAGVIIFLATVI